MKPTLVLVALGLLVCCALLLGTANGAPAEGKEAGASLSSISAIALVCPHLVDLEWDVTRIATTTIGSEECTARWSMADLRRGPDPYDDKTQNSLASLNYLQSYHRDGTVTEGQKYWYDLDMAYDCPNAGLQRVVWILSSSPVSVGGSCQGSVLRNLTLTGELVSPNLAVYEGATLEVLGATVRGGTITSADALIGGTPGGVIRILGARLENTEVFFRAAGDNELTGSTILGDRYNREVWLGREAEVTIAGNEVYSGWIHIAGSPQVVVRDNTFYEGLVTVDVLGGIPQARIRIDRNRFYGSSQGTAIWVSHGSASIERNRFLGSELTSADTAIRTTHQLDAQPLPGAVDILANWVIGWETGIMLAHEGAAQVEGNLILECEDEGVFIRDDSQVSLAGNTLEGNYIALDVWHEPKVTLIDNCLAGNPRGVEAEVPGSDPGWMVDARENWWGDSSGPEHELNPRGRGDSASPRVDISDWLLMDNCFFDIVGEVLDETGGTVTLDSGDTGLSLPAGAVSADTRVSLKSMDPKAITTMPSLPQGLDAVRLFGVSATRVDDGAPVTSLMQEAILTVNYSDEETAMVDEGSLTLHRLSSESQSFRDGSSASGGLLLTGDSYGGETWVLQPSQVDVASNVLAAQVVELGTFAVLGESTAAFIYLPLVVRAGQ